MQTLKIDFMATGDSQHFTREGWGNPERQFCWTTAREAALRVPLSGEMVSLQCHINLSPYIKAPEIPRQRISIFVSDVQVFRATLTSWVEFEFDIPYELVAGRSEVTLRLELPDATAPQSVEKSSDARLLGVAVTAITLKEIQAKEWRALGEIWDRPLACELSDERKVAAVCMVYNEQEYLPIWLKHYARQVGAKNCFVVDHGSTDGSTDGIQQCNILHVPRTPYDPSKQSQFTSQFCSSLLAFYDWVLYTDVDEIVVPDPKVAASISEYCRRPLPPVVTMIGLDMIDVEGGDTEFDPGKPISEQRRFVQANSSMSKPVLISRAIKWAGGSHSGDARTVFDHLYMFHIRLVDYAISLGRLKRQREMEWVNAYAGGHARIQDDALAQRFAALRGLPRLTDVDFDPHSPPVAPFLEAILASRLGLERDAYKISLSIWGNCLWRLPDRFVGSF